MPAALRSMVVAMLQRVAIVFGLASAPWARGARESDGCLSPRAARGCDAYLCPNASNLLGTPVADAPARTCGPLRELAYMHVQKTGGAFAEAILRVCCPGYFDARTGAPADRWQNLPASFSEEQRAACGATVVRHQRENGEMWSFHRPYDVRRQRARAVALFRDPKARVAAAFYFYKMDDVMLPPGFRLRDHPPDPSRGQKRWHEHLYAVLAGSPNPLKTYADLPGISGCQTKMVLGFECARDLAITEAARAEAVRRLREDFAFVGLQEQWESSVELLWRMFGVPGAPRPGVDTATDTHYRQGSYNRTQARRDLARYSDPDDETIFEEARALLIWRCNAFGVEIAEPWGAPTYVNAARRLKRSLRVPVDDPREDARCRGVWNRAVTERGGAIADERDRIWVREDLRQAPGERGQPLALERAPDSSSVRGNSADIRFVVVRKAASRTGLQIQDELAKLTPPRPFTWALVRHPFSKLVSAFHQVRLQIATCCVGGFGRCPTPAEHAICSLPFARAGAGEDEDGRWASRSALLANFIQFVDGMLFDGAFEDLARDGISYHVFSQMYSLRRPPERIDYIVRVGEIGAGIRRLLSLGFGLPPEAVEDFAGSSRLREIAEARDHKGGSSSWLLRDGTEQPELRFEELPNRTRARILEYFEQDYVCLRYSQSGS